MGRTKDHNKILQSPFTLFNSMQAKIEREINHVKKGKPGHIIIKLNSLVEAKMIQALYRASMQGVKIDCIIRSMCSLRPGIPGLSENIQVRSIVGRFLEHDRVIYFANHNEAEVYISSADWAERNLYRRVEIATPIEHPALQQRIIDELHYYLQDNTQAWLLHADGTYTRAAPVPPQEPFTAQQKLLQKLAEIS